MNNQRTVDAVPVSHDLYNQTTKFDIPIWECQYPITVNGVNPMDQETLEVGQLTTIVIATQYLKQGKDPNRPYNWTWAFVRIADQKDKEDREHPLPGGPKPAKSPPRTQNEVARDRSIRSQVALKEAVELVKNTDLSDLETTVARVTMTADAFLDWLNDKNEYQNTDLPSPSIHPGFVPPSPTEVQQDQILYDSDEDNFQDQSFDQPNYFQAGPPPNPATGGPPPAPTAHQNTLQLS